MSITVDLSIEASLAAAEEAKAASKEFLKTAHKYRETAEATCENATQLAVQLKEMYSSDWIKESPHIDVAKYLRYLGTTFTAVNSVQLQMIKQLEKQVVEPLTNFTNYDFLEMHDAKKKMSITAAEYDGMRKNIEGALQGKKGRRGKKEAPDASQIMHYETELERLHTEQEQNQKHLKAVLDQTHQKKETKLLKHMLELMELQYEYHEKAFKLLTNLRPKMVDLRSQLDASIKDVQKSKEGHLMQKASNSSWQKYWYVLKDGSLSAYKGKKDAASLVESLNIMYCTTRIPPKATKGSFTFEIVTPTKKKPIVLQTETQVERESWVKAIQEAIEFQLNQNEPAHEQITANDTLAFKILSSVEGNSHCADCGSPDPDWASINLGILVCLSCSGVHRNLGTHISKVRSTTLDTKAWEPQLLLFMKSIGNKRFNEILEENISPDIPRPDCKKPPDDERPVREKFIKAKYADKLFLVRSGQDKDLLAAELYNVIAAEDEEMVKAFRLVMEGANLEWHNPEDEEKTPMHCAVIFDKLCVLEMMIQNGGSIYCTETRSWTPMHYAAYYHRVYCAALLHRHGFGVKQLEFKDWQNKTAIEIALNGGCDEIVDLLRNQKEKCSVGFTIEDLYADVQASQDADESSEVEHTSEHEPEPTAPASHVHSEPESEPELEADLELDLDIDPSLLPVIDLNVGVDLDAETLEQAEYLASQMPVIQLPVPPVTATPPPTSSSSSSYTAPLVPPKPKPPASRNMAGLRSSSSNSNSVLGGGVAEEDTEVRTRVTSMNMGSPARPAVAARPVSSIFEANLSKISESLAFQAANAALPAPLAGGRGSATNSPTATRGRGAATRGGTRSPTAQ